jgi:hypothetical protein
MEQIGEFPAKFRLWAGIVFVGLAVPLWGSDEVSAVPYIPANCSGNELTLFPLAGKALVVPLPNNLSCVGFSPDGKSVFATDGPKPKVDHSRGLLKIEFNPVRTSVADSAVSMQGILSPDGRWAVDLPDHRGRLVLRDTHNATRTKTFGRAGTMKPA